MASMNYDKFNESKVAFWLTGLIAITLAVTTAIMGIGRWGRGETGEAVFCFAFVPIFLFAFILWFGILRRTLKKPK